MIFLYGNVIIKQHIFNKYFIKNIQILFFWKIFIQK